MADEPPAGGGGDVTQCAVNVICTGVHTPGSTPSPGGGGTGGGGGGGGDQVCQWNGVPMACHDPVYGWFSSSNGCYYRTTSPQPGAEDPVWAGHKPSEGAIYDVTCAYSDGTFGAPQPTFFAQAPAAPPPMNPGTKAKEIWDALTFPFPEPGVAPEGTSVVGVPVWFWLKNATTLNPVTVTEGAISVTVTPKLESVEWDLGDGGPAVVCAGPNAGGTPYEAKYGAAKSPTCGHVFTTGSGGKQGGTFTGTVTTRWRGYVTVTGSNQKVDPKDMSLFTDLKLRVGEVQVLN
ncbi:hypothetical protein [Kitasatospora sp. NPDC090091]|uniref:hypothetical protein n=1 Tax=Kitasatospora sp. NPDC090091 TaxID=3364081 RepID=UPI003813939F